jgi:hypothetical protein
MAGEIRGTERGRDGEQKEGNQEVGMRIRGRRKGQ